MSVFAPGLDAKNIWPLDEGARGMLASRRPLRIAVVGSRGMPSAYSGVERACESLFVRLAARGHKVTCYCRPEYAPDGTQTYLGVTLRSTPTVPTRSLDLLSSSFAAVCYAALSGRYDLVHFHAIPSGLFAPIPKMRGTTIISTIQGLDWQRAKWKGAASRIIKQGERFLVRDATRMIVVSQELKSYFYSQYNRTTSYLPNGIEKVTPSMFSDDSVLREFDLKPKGYFLYLARLVPEKRAEDLIRAFANVRTRQKLVITGEAGYTDKYVAGLRQLAAKDNRVIFTGFQRGNCAHALFHSATAYVLPSELEGLPLALLEAMSHGTPPIVSDIGPHRELLGSIVGYDLFFKPHDVSALTDRLHRILSLPDVYRELGLKIRQFAEESFSWDAVTKLTEDLYFDALQHGPDRAFDFPVASAV